MLLYLTAFVNPKPSSCLLKIYILQNYIFAVSALVLVTPGGKVERTLYGVVLTFCNPSLTTVADCPCLLYMSRKTSVCLEINSQSQNELTWLKRCTDCLFHFKLCLTSVICILINAEKD